MQASRTSLGSDGAGLPSLPRRSKLNSEDGQLAIL